MGRNRSDVQMPIVRACSLCEFGGTTYPLLGELPGALVLAVAEKFDNATLVRGKTVKTNRQPMFNPMSTSPIARVRRSADESLEVLSS